MYNKPDPEALVSAESKANFRLRRACSLGLVLIGAAILLDWALHFLGAHQGAPNLATMKANAAFGFLATGLGFWLLPNHATPSKGVHWRFSAAAFLGLCTVFLATVTLAETVGGMSFGIDEWLFFDPDTPAAMHPGRMAPATAVALICGGTSLFFFGIAGFGRAAMWVRGAHLLALGPAAIGYLALAGYLFDIVALYAFRPFSSVSPASVLGFFFVTSSILSTLPNIGWRARYVDSPIARALLTRLLISALLTPLLAGALIVIGWKAHLYPAELFPAAFVFTSCVIAIVMVYLAADNVRQSDAALNASQIELLRNNEDFLRAQKVGKMGWWRMDMRQNILTWSDENYRIFGAPIGTPLSYESFLAAVHPDDRDFIHAKWITALRGETYDVEHRIVVGGVVKWVHEKAFLEFDGEELLGAFGITQDITAIKRAEKGLAESEERLRLAQASAELGIWDWALDTGKVFWTPELERIFEYGPGEFPGHYEDFAACVLPEDLPEVERSRDAAIAEHRSFDFDFRVRTQSGAIRWVNCKGSAYYDDAGNPHRVIGVNLNITARKELTRQLAEARQRLKAIMEAAPVGLSYSDDITCQRITGNPMLGAQFDIGPEDNISASAVDPAAAGRQVKFYQDGREIADFELPLQMAVAERRAIAPMELEVVMPSGRRWYTLASGAPIFDEGGKIIGGVAATIDITAQRELQEKLVEADQRKDQFLATLAHELRNPLAPIRNAVYVMQRTNSGEQESKLLAMMERQVNHLVRLVDDLLEVSRIKLGKITLKREIVDLHDALRHAAVTVAPQIEAKHHKLTKSEGDQPLFVNGDLTRLTQIFANLLHNAAKFTEAGGCIEISAERVGDTAIVRVRDNGVGISAEMLPRVFDLFAQESIHGEGRDGLGVGLALVCSLVELHGGHVTARSKGRGCGSEFIVQLPLVAASSNNTPIREVCDPLPRARILVVDDLRDVADSFALLLQTLGEEVCTVYSGAEALAAIEQFKPSLAFLDLGMPEMDGCETARRIRQLPDGRHLTLVALSGWGRDEDQCRCGEAGFDHHLLKPVDVAALMQLLQSLPLRPSS